MGCPVVSHSGSRPAITTTQTSVVNVEYDANGNLLFGTFNGVDIRSESRFDELQTDFWQYQFLWDQEVVVTGIRLYDIRDADIRIEGNAISGFQYGIAAYQLDEDTEWAVVGNTIDGAQEDVYYDESVANKPDRS